MARQIITASITREQADVVDALAAQHGGVSAAVQFLVNFYLSHESFSGGNGATPAPAVVEAHQSVSQA